MDVFWTSNVVVGMEVGGLEGNLRGARLMDHQVGVSRDAEGKVKGGTVIETKEEIILKEWPTTSDAVGNKAGKCSSRVPVQRWFDIFSDEGGEMGSRIQVRDSLCIEGKSCLEMSEKKRQGVLFYPFREEE